MRGAPSRRALGADALRTLSCPVSRASFPPRSTGAHSREGSGLVREGPLVAHALKRQPDSVFQLSAQTSWSANPIYQVLKGSSQWSAASSGNRIRVFEKISYWRSFNQLERANVSASRVRRNGALQEKSASRQRSWHFSRGRQGYW